MQENKLVPDFLFFFIVQMNFFDDMAKTKLKNVLLYVFVFFLFHSAPDNHGNVLSGKRICILHEKRMKAKLNRKKVFKTFKIYEGEQMLLQSSFKNEKLYIRSLQGYFSVVNLSPQNPFDIIFKLIQKIG